MAVSVAALTASAQAAPVGGVDPTIANGSAQQALDAARAQWQQAGVVDYHYTVERICFCAPAFRGPAAIVVRNGQALSPPSQFEEVATVPKLHAVVQDAIDDQVERLDVEYGPDGVPLSIEVDPSTQIADEEVSFRVTGFGADRPRAFAKGDLAVHLRWRGPGGDASRLLVCRDGVLLSNWADPAACLRLLADPALVQPITIETRDLRITPDPQLFSAVGHIEGRLVAFTWRGRGSGTRLARLRAWETALGADAIADARGA
jgi:hypothetical protein